MNENVFSSLKLNFFVEFDKNEGILTCQSGVLLSDILDLIVPYGWFLPVTPGTKFITLGGAIASNVHGKNHHKEGAFSNHVLEIGLLNADGEINVSRESEPDLFNLTCGGMGLTGIILRAKIKLKAIETSYIEMKSIKASNLEEAFRLFDTHKECTYSMAWIDTLSRGKGLGRSIIMLGEHTKAAEVNKKCKLKVRNKSLFKVPIFFPGWILNRLFMKIFNVCYYNKQIKKEVIKNVHYDGFFYPLDSIIQWNKMYGKSGFIQYQVVFPMDKSYDGIVELLSRSSSSVFGSFLSVLKLMGPEDNLVSFPMEGYTLAMDFPIREGLFEFLDELDEIVLKHGGRNYLSKDARMTRKNIL